MRVARKACGSSPGPISDATVTSGPPTVAITSPIIPVVATTDSGAAARAAPGRASAADPARSASASLRVRPPAPVMFRLSVLLRMGRI